MLLYLSTHFNFFEQKIRFSSKIFYKSLKFFFWLLYCMTIVQMHQKCMSLWNVLHSQFVCVRFDWFVTFVLHDNCSDSPKMHEFMKCSTYTLNCLLYIRKHATFCMQISDTCTISRTQNVSCRQLCMTLMTSASHWVPKIIFLYQKWVKIKETQYNMWGIHIFYNIISFLVKFTY